MPHLIFEMKKEIFDEPLEKIFHEFPGMWHLREKIAEITISAKKQLEIDLRSQTTLRTHPNAKKQKESLHFLGDHLLAIIRDGEKKKNDVSQKKEIFSSVRDKFKVDSVCDEVRIEEMPFGENELGIVFYFDGEWERRISFDRPEVLEVVKKNGLDLGEFLHFVVLKVKNEDGNSLRAISDSKKISEFFAKNGIDSTEN